MSRNKKKLKKVNELNFETRETIDLYENEDFFNEEYEYEYIVKDALKNGLSYSNPY